MSPEPVADGGDPPPASHRSAVVDVFVVFLKGLAMGAADAVPGVSGGTIALITGIYERLIRAITRLDPAVLVYLHRIHRPDGRRALGDELQEMDVPFLIALGTGMVSAIVVLSRIIQVALTHARGPTFAFFFGLIGASAIVLGRREWLRSPAHVVAIVAGGAIAFLVAGASGQGLVPHTLPVTFFAGVVAICGMVLPGISGAFILLLLGQYDPLTAALNGFVDGVIGVSTAGVTADFRGDATVVVIFLLGAGVGLLTVAYVVRWALEAHRSLTLAFLVSLMIGALRLPVIEMAAVPDGGVSRSLGVLLLAAGVGVVAVLALDRFTDDLEY